MANIKFSAFTQKVALGDVDFLVGYTGADNVRVAPSVLSSVYLPLAGGTMTGSTNHGDNIKSIYGTGGDFEIYHSGSTSYIADVGSGDLKVLFSNDFIIEAINGETCATFTENGAVDLYYDNTLMVSTVSEGINLPSNNVLFLDNTNDNNPVYFRNAGTNAATLQIGRGTTPGSNLSMTIDNTGQVGIGIVPTTILDIGGMADPVVRIKSDVGGDPQLIFDGSAANRSGVIKFYDNGALAGGFIDYHHLGDKMNFGAGSVSTVTMTVSDGDVGIGTDSPDERLHILDTTGANIILNSDANGVSSGVYMSEGADATPTQNGAYVYYDGTNNEFKIATGAGALTDQLTIDRDTGDATFAGNVSLTDNKYLYIGASNDLQLYHDGTDSYISNTQNSGDLIIQNGGNDKDVIFKCDDGAGGLETYFYLDGSGGGSAPFTVWPDEATIALGSGHDLRISHSGTQSKIENYGGTGSFEITQHVEDADLDLRCDNGSGGSMTYLRLDGSITSMVGFTDLLFFDDLKLKFGDSQDLEIYHDGNHSRIKDMGTGHLIINATDFVVNNSADTANMIIATDGGAVSLYTNGAIKFQTSSTGTTTTGQMNIAALNTAPASASAAGTLGEIRYTADYIYVCTATNTWKRTALSTW